MSETRAGTMRPAYPVDEVLPAGRLAVLGFQHVLAMYTGAVAATGIGTLSRVVPKWNAYVIIIAVSPALDLIPVVSPDFYSGFSPGVQIVLNSGITAGSIAVIALNVAFNILGGAEHRPDPASVATPRMSGDTREPV